MGNLFKGSHWPLVFSPIGQAKAHDVPPQPCARLGMPTTWVHQTLLKLGGMAHILQ